jgi:hypothetical protein
MEFKKVLLLGLSVLCALPTALQARSARTACKKAECTLAGCQCYCGAKCGPRQITKDDKPRYDAKRGKCFCAPRDPALYEENQCAQQVVEQE